MVRGWLHKAEAVVLSLVGLVSFFFLLQTSHLAPKETEGHPATLTEATAAEAPSPFQPCRENASVANVSGFSELPGHIQDFLRYKHCRHFPLLLDAPEKCGPPGASDLVFLLLAIKSSPGNYERREAIRKTWGRERTFAGVRIRRVFLSGEAAGPGETRKLNRLLRLEAEEHGDVLQWAFRDTFFNLTLKQALFHDWLGRRCPGVRFLLNGDDDVFANTDNIVRYLLGVPGAGEGHLFVGQLIAHVGPVRERWSKYYVPEQVSAAKSYPPYCGGGGLLMSGYTAHAVRRASRDIELFPIDDVYLGMCLERVGLAPGSHMGIRTVGVRVPSATLDAFDPCYYRELLLVHRFVPYEMRVMWAEIHRPGLVCGKKVSIFGGL